MRSHALIALASLGVVALTIPCAAQTAIPGEPQSVSVAKKPTPQLLAPSQPQPDEAVAAAVPPAPSPPPQAMPAVAPPTEVKSETYATMRPPVPMTPVGQTPEPQGAFSSPDRLMDWMSNYRNHKSPTRVPVAVHAMKDYGLFADEEKAWFCTGFIAGVLGSNPKDGPNLIPGMFPMPDKEQAVIIRAIAYSGRPDWRELLEKTSPRTPLRRPLINDFLAGKRPTLMELPLDTGGSPGIYALWGYYVATGQYEPVVRIMQALRWSKRKGDSGFSFRKVFTGWGSDPSAIDKITTGGTAKWTLASYAERDRALLALYRAEYARQPQDIALPLKDVIDAAEIFESEKVRKDQFGAIENSQRA